jgi:hypothetical protein
METLSMAQRMALKAALDKAAQTIADSPDWLRVIYARNIALEKRRAEQLAGNRASILAGQKAE